jgi:hypothetical protein
MGANTGPQTTSDVAVAFLAEGRPTDAPDYALDALVPFVADGLASRRSKGRDHPMRDSSRPRFVAAPKAPAPAPALFDPPTALQAVAISTAQGVWLILVGENGRPIDARPDGSGCIHCWSRARREKPFARA